MLLDLQVNMKPCIMIVFFCYVLLSYFYVFFFCKFSPGHNLFLSIPAGWCRVLSMFACLWGGEKSLDLDLIFASFFFPVTDYLFID